MYRKFTARARTLQDEANDAESSIFDERKQSVEQLPLSLSRWRDRLRHRQLSPASEAVLKPRSDVGSCSTARCRLMWEKHCKLGD